ncbi:MAG: protein-glutamate O-methyltransferase CheR [Fibrobacterales bacterium]
MMDTEVFVEIKNIVYAKAGITLDSKEALVSARLAKRLRKLKLSNESEYLNFLKNDNSGNELVQLLDVISTNFTSFYREPDHFGFLTELMDTWIRNGQKNFKIWCAAASSGEEPYTLAMTLQEVMSGKNIDVKMLATDISTAVLEKCKAGEYPDKSLHNVPLAYKKKYFTEKISQGEKNFVATNTLKSMIKFARLNLIEAPYPMSGPMDMIFCRNVMIYFDNIIRKRIVDEAYRLLKPGGYLVISHSESLTGIENKFKTIKPSIYLKV